MADTLIDNDKGALTDGANKISAEVIKSFIETLQASNSCNAESF